MDNVETVQELVEERLPLLTVWVWPRRTIRSNLRTTPVGVVVLWLTIAGITPTFEKISRYHGSDEITFQTLLLAAAGIAPLYTLIDLFLVGPALAGVGALFDGIAKLRDVWVALAWGAIPRMVVTVVWLMAIMVYGPALFPSETSGAEGTWRLTTVFPVAVADILLTLWGIWITVICIAEVHRFSVWRAFVTSVVSLLLAGVTLIFAAFMMYGALRVLRPV